MTQEVESDTLQKPVARSERGHSCSLQMKNCNLKRHMKEESTVTDLPIRLPNKQCHVLSLAGTTAVVTMDVKGKVFVPKYQDVRDVELSSPAKEEYQGMKWAMKSVSWWKMLRFRGF